MTKYEFNDEDIENAYEQILKSDELNTNEKINLIVVLHDLFDFYKIDDIGGEEFSGFIVDGINDAINSLNKNTFDIPEYMKQHIKDLKNIENITTGAMEFSDLAKNLQNELPIIVASNEGPIHCVGEGHDNKFGESLLEKVLESLEDDDCVSIGIGVMVNNDEFNDTNSSNEKTERPNGIYCSGQDNITAWDKLKGIPNKCDNCKDRDGLCGR